MYRQQGYCFYPQQQILFQEQPLESGSKRRRGIRGRRQRYASIVYQHELVRRKKEEELMGGEERIKRYFASPLANQSGLMLVCIANAGTGQDICIGATPNFSKLFFGLSRMKVYGIPLYPHPDDQYHLGFGKYGFSRRVNPRGTENHRPKAIVQQTQPMLYNEDLDYTINVISDLDLFGPLTIETLQTIRDCGLLDDFCTMIANHTKTTRLTWLYPKQFKGWTRPFSHQEQINREDNQEQLPCRPHAATLNRKGFSSSSSYRFLTAHIQQTTAQAVITQARVQELRDRHDNRDISTLDVLPPSATSTEFFSFAPCENQYIAQLLFSLTAQQRCRLQKPEKAVAEEEEVDEREDEVDDDDDDDDDDKEEER